MVGLAALAACGVMSAQEPAKTAPAKKESVQGKADVLKAAWGSKTEMLLKGNVTFTSDDTVLSSDEITYDKKTKIAVSPGKLTITNPECDVSGDKGTAYLEKKLGIIQGNVRMLVKPKKTAEAAQEKDSIKSKMSEPTTITCPKLEYLYGTKLATATGGVHFKQEKRSAKADKAVYDGKKELLTLTGNVDGVDEDGQTFKAPSVTISLKKGDEWMEATGFSGSFKVEIEEDSGNSQ